MHDTGSAPSTPRGRGSRVIGTPQAQAWTALRDAAIDAAARGWPVLPGTFYDRPFGIWRGAPGAQELSPITADWAGTGITDPQRAETEWIRHPWSVLLECGRGVDVLELPGRVAERALLALTTSGPVVPVAVLLYPARFLLFTAAPTTTEGGGLISPLTQWPGVRYHGPGGWVPLPPTDLGPAAARWQVRPPETLPQLPDPHTVQHVLATALHGAL